MQMYKGFKMKLYPGMEEEYERRHNLLWPEMQESIHNHGGKDYSIFLDPETLTLYGSITANGGTIWPTSWIPIRTTAPSAKTSIWSSISTEQRFS